MGDSTSYNSTEGNKRRDVQVSNAEPVGAHSPPFPLYPRKNSR